jgi:hypothetical protein
MIEWLLFLLVFFLYIHVIHQYKSSEDYEIYEMDYFDNTNLQEMCQLLQPLVFSWNTDIFPKIPTLEDAVYESGEIALSVFDDPQTYPIQIPLEAAMKLFTKESPEGTETPSNKKYFTEKNQEFLQETDRFKDHMKDVDAFLSPPFVLNTDHDFCIGSRDAHTALRYHVHSRKFCVVTQGKISVKMVPWKKNGKHLHEIRDYERGEYRSPMNVWNPQETYRREYKKLSFLEFDVHAGHVLYIPPYWGYSFKVCESKTAWLEYTYATWFNRLAFVGEIGRTWLQSQNISYKTARSWSSSVSSATTPKHSESEAPVDVILLDGDEKKGTTMLPEVSPDLEEIKILVPE